MRGLADSNEIQIDINNANLQIANNYSANYMILSLSGPGSIKIDNLSA